MTFKEQMRVTAELMAYLAHDCGLEVVAAGGCARDWLHGRAAKDVDLCVLNCQAHAAASYERAVAQVQDHLETLGDAQDIEVYESYRKGDKPGRLLYCIKFTYCGVAFDLLSYYSAPSSAQAQVEEFDANINMAWAEAEAEGKVLTLKWHQMFGDVCSGLQPIRPTRFNDGPSDERIDYLQSKYPMYQKSYDYLEIAHAR